MTLTVGDLGVCKVICNRRVSIGQRGYKYILADSRVAVLLSEDALEGKRALESIDLVDSLLPRLLADGVRLVLADGANK